MPTIAIEITEDAVEGWNLQIRTTDFRIMPENVSTGHVDGEGHMYLYIDGVKVSRIYGEWHHITGLQAGRHNVRVELSSNNHSALAVNGGLIDATANIFQDRRTNLSLVRDGAVEANEPHPSVRMEIVLGRHRVIYRHRVQHPPLRQRPRLTRRDQHRVKDPPRLLRRRQPGPHPHQHRVAEPPAVDVEACETTQIELESRDRLTIRQPEPALHTITVATRRHAAPPPRAEQIIEHRLRKQPAPLALQHREHRLRPQRSRTNADPLNKSA